jgi:hypothetical protein
LVIRSPQTGYVVDKKIVQGSSVDAKMTLFEVADLSTIWVEAGVYEKDIPFLQVGQKVEATVEAVPNRVFHGRIAILYPELETATRTNRIRFELDNAQHELRPGMFAMVRIDTPLESIEPFHSMGVKNGRVAVAGSNLSGVPRRYEFLCVPERAVVDTGSKKIVYVEREPGLFEGVEVELGPRDDEFYPVIQGLRAGDKVAAAGSFLIDAETRLNPAAASSYFGASGGPQSNDRSTAPLAPGQPNVHKDARDSGNTDSGKRSGKTEQIGEQVVLTPEDLKNIESLPETDRRLAIAQRTCPITGAPLGSMGVPVKIILRGQTVFLCCKGCVGKAKANPAETLKKVASLLDAGKRRPAEQEKPRSEK